MSRVAALEIPSQTLRVWFRKSTSLAAEHNQESYDDLRMRIEKSHSQMFNMRHDIGEISSLTHDNNSILARLSGTIARHVL